MRISGVKVRQAELHRRKVRGVQRGGTGGKARPQGHHVLWLRELSQLQIYLGAQADSREVSKLRQRISGGEKSEGRAGHCLSQQRVRIRAARPTASAGSRGDHSVKAHGVKLMV